MSDLDRQSLGLGCFPALVLVDLSEGFTNPDSPLGVAAEDTLEACQHLLHGFRQYGFPVFFTTVLYDDPGQARVFRQRLPALECLRSGSRWVEIDERVEPLDSEPVIVKRFASAFFGTDLSNRLEAGGVDSLVIGGLTTSGCVRATVVDGLQHDFRVVVAREATGDRNPAAHDACLFDLNAKYADVISLREVLKQLETKFGPA